MTAPVFDLTRFFGRDEGQHFDRKSMFEGEEGKKRLRDRRRARDRVAEQVAGFADAEGGVLILGIEDDRRVTGHQLPPDAIAALDVPRVRLHAPQPQLVHQHDGHSLMVFDVPKCDVPVRVEGDGFPLRLVRDQFIAKLQRKKRHLSDLQAQDFETRAGMPPDAFIRQLRTMAVPDIAAWFTQNPDLGEILDRKGYAIRPPTHLSVHEDTLNSAERGYGKAKKPADYLKGFSDFIKSRSNTIAPLVTVHDRLKAQLRDLLAPPVTASATAASSAPEAAA